MTLVISLVLSKKRLGSGCHPIFR